MNLIQSVSFVSSTTESLRIPSHVLEAAHYFKEYCYEEIHFIIICHHWTLKIGISWRFTEHFAAVLSARRVSTQLLGVSAYCCYVCVQVFGPEISTYFTDPYTFLHFEVSTSDLRPHLRPLRTGASSEIGMLTSTS